MTFLISVKPIIIGLLAGAVLIVLATAIKLMNRLAASSDTSSSALLVAPKPHFFTMSEISFYAKLARIAQERELCVFPKVGLNEVFANKPGADLGQSSRYARMRVDYLLVTCEDYRPVAGIELSNSTHASGNHGEQDAEKSAVFNAAWLPLIRFTPGAQAQEIREQLDSTLGHKSVAA